MFFYHVKKKLQRQKTSELKLGVNLRTGAPMVYLTMNKRRLSNSQTVLAASICYAVYFFRLFFLKKSSYCLGYIHPKKSKSLRRVVLLIDGTS